MRNFSLFSLCALLLLVAACGDSSSGSSEEITSQDDVQRLFEAIVPDLVEAFTELASQEAFAVSALSGSTDEADKNGSSSVSCPGGGTLDVDLATGQASLTDCSAGGVTISASLALFVLATGPSSYQANFNGSLTVRGGFNGTVDVVSAFVEWMDPATESNTVWNVTVSLNGQTFTVAGGGNTTLRCDPYDPPGGPNSGAPYTACDEDSDCQSNSCRGPELNSQFGCTCIDLAGSDCPPVRVSPGSVGFGGACDDQADCEGGLPCVDCECI